MGASVGTDQGGVDIEINVVPFIDLMSCLTAFLLVTAVWSQHAQINIRPKGLSKNTTEQVDPKIEVDAAVLITANEIWVGLSVGDRRQISNTGDGYDWESLNEALVEYKGMPEFDDRFEIEIGAEDDVQYQEVISAMDEALAAGFRDLGYVDPASMKVQFKE